MLKMFKRNHNKNPSKLLNKNNTYNKLIMIVKYRQSQRLDN